MFKTDFAQGRTRVPIGLVLIYMLFCQFGTIQAQNFLACNDGVNISLSSDCEALITPDMILEGEENYPPPYNILSNYTLTIETLSGSGVASDVYSAVLTEPGYYTVHVYENVYPEPNNSCWGTILVEDKLPPVLLDPPTYNGDTQCGPCPVGNSNPNCVIQTVCSDAHSISSLIHQDMVPVPGVMDCSNVDTNFVLYEVYDADVCAPVSIRVIYKFVDADGNSVESCKQEYTIEPIDVFDDIVGPLGHVDLPCGSSLEMNDVYTHFFNTILAQELATATNSEEELEAYATAHEQAQSYAWPTIYGKQLADDICNTATIKTDVEVPACEGCGDFSKVIRTWTVFDWCSGVNQEYIQILTNKDHEGPIISVNPISVSVDPWACYGTFLFPNPDKLTDACTANQYLTYEVTGPGIIHYDPDKGYIATEVPKGAQTFYYTGYDCCGNSTTIPVVITVNDATPPIAIAKQDIVVSLTPTYDGEGIAKVFASSIDNDSHDGCSDVKLEIRRDTDFCDFTGNSTYNNDDHSYDYILDEDNGEFIKLCCSDISENGIDENGDGVNDYALVKVWLRVWDDGDMDGVYGSANDNYNETWAYVRVEDKVPASILCPPDVTLSCAYDYDDPFYVGEALAYNTCGEAEVDYKDIEKEISSCGDGHIVRQWYVVGHPGIFCVQNITIELEDQSIVNVHFPNDTIIDCTAALDNMIPYWYAGECDQLAYSVDRDTFFFEDGACYKIFNYWTVINWCSYDPLDPDTDGIWSDLQIVKIIDDIPPSLINKCDEVMMFEVNDINDSDYDDIVCENNAVMLTNIADDAGDCASNWLKWTIQIDLWNDWNIDYIYSSTANPSSIFYVPPTSSGEQVKITLPDGIEGSMANHRVIWKVSDGCGNNRSCNQEFMVVDKTAPTPYCVNVSTALMDNGTVDLWACDFDLGSYDNCSAYEDLRFTFSDVHPDDDPTYSDNLKCSTRTFTCDDLFAVSTGQATPVEVTVYVWDEKDNRDYCTVYLSLVDNQGFCDDTTTVASRADIGGRIRTESGEELSDVSVELFSSLPNFPISTITHDNGHYAFDNNVMYADYEISGFKNDDYLNGVTTLDLVQIQKHILGTNPLVGPYKYIAADINSDEKVSAIDLVELRKLILGVYDVLPNNGSWRILEKSQQMEFNNPWPFLEIINITQLDNDEMEHDFIAVKVGDVNNTAVANANGAITQNRSAQYLDLNIKDLKVSPGQLVDVPVSVNDATELAGIQFTLATNGVQLMNILPGVLDVDNANFAMIDQFTTSFSWNAVKTFKAQKNEVLFTLRLKGLSSVQTSNALQFNDDIAQSEAYVNTSLDIVNLRFASDTELGYTLFQNSPNPFNGSTNISFTLPTTQEAVISIIDVNGKVVKAFNGSYSAGVNTIQIDEDQLSGSGIYYYRLECDGFYATKKMIILN